MDKVRMNPPRRSPDLIEPAGPTDPEIAFLSVRSRPTAGRSPCWPTTRCTTWAGCRRAHDLGRLLRHVRRPHPGTARRRPARPAVRGHHVQRHQRRHQQHRLPGHAAPKGAPTRRCARWPTLVAQKVFEAHEKVEFHDWVDAGRGRRRNSPWPCASRPPSNWPAPKILEKGDDDEALPLAREGLRPALFAARTSRRTSLGDPAGVPHRRRGHRDDPLRGLCRDRAGDQGEEPASSRPSRSRWPTAPTATCPRPRQHALGGYETWMGTNNVELERLGQDRRSAPGDVRRAEVGRMPFA